jgi:GH35 family endo-1,4-beta-xylanase
MNTTPDSDIKKHRTSQVTLTVLDENRRPFANREMTVAQKNHKFPFGITGSSVIALANEELTGDAKKQAELHNEKLLKLFNFVTLPFYWGRFEPQRGKPDTRRILKTAKWFADRGCLVKGHPLCWHTVSADWLLPLSNAEIIDAQRSRITRDVTDFTGPIDMWDVINEVVIMPIFDKYDNGITRICRELGRIGIIRMTFDAARAANPRATLLLNDFDLSAAFECLIEDCLEAGIRIDALGLQSHMHQGYWGVEKTLGILERYARYKLPIHFTESTLVSGKIMPPEIVDLNDYKVDEWPTTPEGEARQAEEVVQHYKTLFARPSVEAVTWWGLEDGGWLKAPSGLVRADHSAKPAYDALLNLVKGEWWLPPTKFVTDARGQLQFTGYLGQYTLSSGSKTKTLDLNEKGSRSLELLI